MASWNTLPNEIRYIILKHLKKRQPGEDGEASLHLAVYASVSREWQQFFEHYTFKFLYLEDKDLVGFSLLVNNNKTRLSYIRMLWLHVDLVEYDCNSCKTDEDKTTIDRNNRFFTTALWALFSTLSLWTFADHQMPRDSGICLDLSASSRSECQHSFRDFRLQKAYPNKGSEALYGTTDKHMRYLNRIYHLTDEPHGWRSGMRHKRPTLGAARRLLGRPLQLDKRSLAGNAPQLPRVEILTGLIIRRQFYRLIHPGVIAQVIVNWLPSLRVLNLEQWRQVQEDLLDEVDEGFVRLFSLPLPKKLHEVRLFQDTNRFLHPPTSPLLARPPSVRLAQQLARSSQYFRTLTVSFYMDAADFFRPPLQTGAGPPSPEWPSLMHLALTSPRLSHTADCHEAQELLWLACKAVARMPRLQILELWYGGDQHGTIFRFTTNPPTVVLKSTRNVRSLLSKELQAAWKQAALQYSNNPVTVDIRQWAPGSDFATYSGVLDYVHLQQNIVTTLSIHQLALERIEWRYLQEA